MTIGHSQAGAGARVAGISSLPGAPAQPFDGTDVELLAANEIVPEGRSFSGYRGANDGRYEDVAGPVRG